MNLRWGVMPFRLDFTESPEENILRTFKARPWPSPCCLRPLLLPGPVLQPSGRV